MLPAPARLFNPLLVPPHEPLTGPEISAGPYGLLLFLPLVPLLRWAARSHRPAALIGTGLLWLLLTLGPYSAVVLVAGTAIGAGWIVLLGGLRRRAMLSRRGMIGLTWVGLHALVLPLWWVGAVKWYGWEPTRLPILHNIGFAYYLLRFVAWGRQWAEQPDRPLRLIETVSWILYPPCMRLGPVLTREVFLARYDAWQPAAPVPWRLVGYRLGLCLVGLFLLGVTIANMPDTLGAGKDFFAAPHLYATPKLLALVFLIPVQIYLLLWTYNELAAGLSAWVGVRVDDNFYWLPLATSVRDFWRRWHITVGSWLRDNIYIPLGGNRRHAWLNTTVVFAYIGVWHGPSWSFLAWGLAQAAALAVQRGWDRFRARRGWTDWPRGWLWTAACWVATMLFAILTIAMFADFEHLGTRLFLELWNRLW